VVSLRGRGCEMRKRRNWLDWIVVSIVLIGVAIVAVYAYQSYRESREKKEAREAFQTYGNAVMDVRRSYIRAYNKLYGKESEETRGAVGRFDSWADVLQRAAKALTAIEPPGQFADAHAVFVQAWRQEVPFIRKHARIGRRILSNEPTDFLDFAANDAWRNRLLKEFDIVTKADKRVEAAWEKWRTAANQEAKRLGVTVSGD